MKTLGVETSVGEEARRRRWNGEQIRERRFGLLGRNMRGSKWEFYGLLIINVESDLYALIGGCVASFQFAWAAHFGWLGWHHQGVKMAQSWPSKLASNSIIFY